MICIMIKKVEFFSIFIKSLLILTYFQPLLQNLRKILCPLIYVSVWKRFVQNYASDPVHKKVLYIKREMEIKWAFEMEMVLVSRCHDWVESSKHFQRFQFRGECIRKYFFRNLPKRRIEQWTCKLSVSLIRIIIY